MKLMLLLAFFSLSSIANNCVDFYTSRGESIDFTDKGIDCYEKQISSTDASSNKLILSETYNKLSYLYFFKATYYKESPINNLFKSYVRARKSVKLYGEVFSYSGVDELTELEKSQLALSYYLYGTSLSKYVDLKGKLEAIKRMKDIKNSMRAILRLKKKETFHYGAYRTLAIFYYKVPSIAGGDTKKSNSFFKKLMKESTLSSGVSSYLVNHYFYADFLLKSKRKKSACFELGKIQDITISQIEKDHSDLYYESIRDVADAKKRFESLNCATI